MTRAFGGIRTALAVCLLISSVLAAVSVARQSPSELRRHFDRARATLLELVVWIDASIHGARPRPIAAIRSRSYGESKPAASSSATAPR